MSRTCQVPLIALSNESRALLSTLLNPPKIIPGSNGIPRDWRGLVQLLNLGGELVPYFASHLDPIALILNTTHEKRPNCTVKDLQDALEGIERWDVLDDSETLFERDAEAYLERLSKSQTSAPIINSETEENMLTVDDLYRHRQGLNGQNYDAFLLYADEDTAFATEVIDNLENKYHLKLCLRDRDLIGGVTFEHEAVMRLISERCNRLIVIISPNFIKSSANKFFLNYAQAVGIDKRQRKIIPCLYERCTLPIQVSYMFILDYNRLKRYNFWERLRDSVKASSPELKRVSPSKDEMSSHRETVTDPVEIPKEVTLNGFRDQVSETSNDHLSSSRSIETLESTKPLSKSLLGVKYVKLFRWTRKKLTKGKDESKVEVNLQNHIEESMALPSLGSLDTISTVLETDSDKNISTVLETDSDRKGKKKLTQKCRKKAQSLLLRS